MADESLLSALQEEWGDETTLANQPLTIKSLTSQLQLWLKNAQLQLRHLPSQLGQMQVKVQEAADATRRDLEQQLDPQLDGLMRDSLQDYEDLGYYLGELRAGVSAQDRARVSDDLLQLRGAARSLADHQQAITDWMSAPVLRCPRCGGQERRGQEWTCAVCGLEMLYPGTVTASRTTADLGPEFKVVHDVYVSIIKGDRTLSTLFAPLQQLRVVVDGYADMAEGSMASDVAVSRALDGVAMGARDAADGIHLMERVRENRQTRDLHAGWQLIFDGCVAIQGEVPVLMKAEGMEVPAARGYADDGIFLSEED